MVPSIAEKLVPLNDKIYSGPGRRPGGEICRELPILGNVPASI